MKIVGWDKADAVKVLQLVSISPRLRRPGSRQANRLMGGVQEGLAGWYDNASNRVRFRNIDCGEDLIDGDASLAVSFQLRILCER